MHTIFDYLISAHNIHTNICEKYVPLYQDTLESDRPNIYQKCCRRRLAHAFLFSFFQSKIWQLWAIKRLKRFFGRS